MSEQEFNDIKEVLTTFTYYIQCYENESRPTVEEIKDHFKAAFFIEKTIKNVEDKNIVQQFIKCLNSWLETQNINNCYDVEFYKYACDNTLLKYFKFRKFDIDIALRMYTSSCNEERFRNVLNKLFVQNGINESLLNYCVSHNEFKNGELEARLMVLSWKSDISIEKYETVKQEIENMFESYKIDTYLPLLIGILSLEPIDEHELSINALILHYLLPKMEDRSILSKDFWVTLIKNVNKNSLLAATKQYKKFLVALLNFLVYCGCMMNYKLFKNNRVWYSDKNSICPEISFDDITTIVKLLLSSKGEIAEYTAEHLENEINITNSLFWNDVVKLYL